MPLGITLTRRNIKRGDTLDAPDFSGGFVASAIIDPGQSYEFGAGTNAMPSIACDVDPDTGFAWDGNNALRLISAGQAVGVITPTGLGLGTLSPNTDSALHVASQDACVRLESTVPNHHAKLRVSTKGNARADLWLENLDAEGNPLQQAILTSNGPEQSFFSDGTYTETGSIQLGTAQNRSLQTIVANQVITTHRSDRLEIRPGKDFRLGQNTTAYQAPNCSIIVQAADGSTIYLAAKK